LRELINATVESAVLGSVVLDNPNFFEIAEKLRPEDFGLDSNRRIFRRMRKLIDAGRTVDPLTLQNELQRHGELNSVGGECYLSSLTDGLPRFREIASWIGIVGESSRLRKLHTALRSSIAEIEGPGLTSTEIGNQLELACLTSAPMRPGPT
jgi:replicative DNA helicase